MPLAIHRRILLYAICDQQRYLSDCILRSLISTMWEIVCIYLLSDVDKKICIEAK